MIGLIVLAVSIAVPVRALLSWLAYRKGVKNVRRLTAYSLIMLIPLVAFAVGLLGFAAEAVNPYQGSGVPGETAWISLSLPHRAISGYWKADNGAFIPEQIDGSAAPWQVVRWFGAAKWRDKVSWNSRSYTSDPPMGSVLLQAELAVPKSASAGTEVRGVFSATVSYPLPSGNGFREEILEVREPLSLRLTPGGWLRAAYMVLRRWGLYGTLAALALGLALNIGLGIAMDAYIHKS